MKKLALGLLAAAFKSELLTYDVKTTKAIRSNMELDATPSVSFSLFQKNQLKFSNLSNFENLDF